VEHLLKRVWTSLYAQVLFAIALGIALGAIWPDTAAAMKPLADGLIKLVKMIIAPVIFLTIVTGITGLTSLRGVGRLAAKAFGYFLVMSTFALIVGLVVANIVQPGRGMNVSVAELDGGAVSDFVAKAHDQHISDFLLNIIPRSFIGAFADGDILQVLLIAVLMGVALLGIGERAAPLLAVFRSATEAVFRIVDILMRAAPLGAFGGMAFTVGKYGLASLAKLAALIGTFYLTSLLFVLIVLGAVCALCGFSILKLLRFLRSELLLVLGTSSSEAALPKLIEKMEAAGCQRSIVGVVVPTGYSFNLDGTNIYMTLAALFIAQATGIQLSLGDQLLLLAVAMLSSKGAAGVTGAGFVTLAATLTMLPMVPVAGMALIVGIDRFMSECRSLTNFIGNAVATVVVARWENALDMQQLRKALQ
jgi:aerobic C4-dicarboxylate transport protein